jgi:stalled ribosome rescue protein Dom34
MSAHYHAVLWIDHHEARIIHFNAEDADSKRVRPADPPRHLHVKAGSASGTHITEEPQFYRDVAAALGDAQEILVAGPSTAKMEFVKYLNQNAAPAARHVVGVETLDHLTDKQLLVEARKFFARADRFRPQI